MRSGRLGWQRCTSCPLWMETLIGTIAEFKILLTSNVCSRLTPALGFNSKLMSSFVACSFEVTQPWKPFAPLKQWLDSLDLGDEMIFSFVVQLFPSQCPFERDFIFLVACWSLSFPPMCKIHPLFEQLVALRFRCICHPYFDEQLRISCSDSAQV